MDHIFVNAKLALNRLPQVVETGTNATQTLMNVLSTLHVITHGVHTLVSADLGLKERVVEFARILTNVKGRQMTAQLPDHLGIARTQLVLISVRVALGTH